MINRGFQNLVFEKKGLMAHLKQGFSSFICPFFSGQKMKKKIFLICWLKPIFLFALGLKFRFCALFNLSLTMTLISNSNHNNYNRH